MTLPITSEATNLFKVELGCPTLSARTSLGIGGILVAILSLAVPHLFREPGARPHPESALYPRPRGSARRECRARSGNIIAMVIRRGAILAVIGVLGGLLLASVTSRALRTILHDVSPLDPLIALLLLATAVVAAYVPARRASRADPAGGAAKRGPLIAPKPSRGRRLRPPTFAALSIVVLACSCTQSRSEAAAELSRFDAAVRAHVADYGRYPETVDAEAPADSLNLPYRQTGAVSLRILPRPDGYEAVATGEDWICSISATATEATPIDCFPATGSGQ